MNKINSYLLVAALSSLLGGQSSAETLSLNKGWNLVSSSLQSRAIGSGGSGTPFKYEVSQQQWSSSDLITPAAHEGFWYLATEDETVEITGDTVTPSLAETEPNWMLVGDMGETTAANLVTKLESEFGTNSELKVASLFSYKNGVWHHYDPLNARGDLGAIDSGDGIWAQVWGVVSEGQNMTEDSPSIFSAYSVPSSDTSAAEYHILSQGDKGVASIDTSSAEVKINFYPYSNMTGSDEFTYEMISATGSKRVVTVALDLSSENDLPLVLDESVSVDMDASAVSLRALLTPEGGSLSGDPLLSNDVDVDGDDLVLTITSDPAHGTITTVGAGDTVDYQYTPTAEYVGIDQFTYSVSDGIGDAVVGTVSITVKDANQTYTITGTVTAGAGTASDGDVNHPNAPCSYNGSQTLDSAQVILNPATVGGYARAPDGGTEGRGRAGNSNGCEGTTGYIPPFDDLFDFYRVSLVEGQEVGLYLGDDPSVNDLDLVIKDNDGNIVSSLGSGERESVIVQNSGDYYILVNAFAGASNYVLTVGQSASSSAMSAASLGRSTLRIEDNFVQGDIILKQKDLPGMSRSLQRHTEALGLEKISSGEGVRRSARYQIKQQQNEDQRTAFKTQQTMVERMAEILDLTEQQQENLKTIYMIKELRKEESIEYAEPNYILQAMATEIVEPNDTHYGKQWHYPMINLPMAWTVTTAENAPVVAVIDTGVVLNHPDLQGQLVDGYDFIADTTSAGDGDGYDNNPDDVGDGTVSTGGTRSSSFHGTHVAGTIAATSNNGTGISGVAWGAKIMPLRALGRSGGTSYDIEQAMRYAGGLSNDSGTVPTQIADVVNMSLGGSGFSRSNQDVVSELREAGVLFIAAAGNSAISSPFYPASYDGVVSVSSVGFDSSALAPYSNYGAYIDIAAPGGNSSVDANGDGFPDGVLSTLGTDSGEFVFGFLQGTSMASPHVAGVVALMRSVNPSLTPDQLDYIITNGEMSHDLGATGRDDLYGYGLIDAYNAVIAASQLSGATTEVTEIQAVLTVRPSAANFGMSIDELSIDISNSTGGTLTTETPTTDADWLTISASDEVGSDALGAYTLSVNRDNLALGPHTATIVVSSTAGTINLPVIVQKVDANIPGDAGHHTVALINASDYTTQDSVEVDAVDGEYSYSFDEVPAGDYLIIAGTDSDYDGIICDAGEACGAYPFYEPGSMNPVTLNADGTFDFATSFDIRVRSSTASVGGEFVPKTEGFSLHK